MIVAKISVLVFVVCAMMGTGARLKFGEIVGPLRNARLVATSLIVSYILVPLTVYAIVKIFPLDTPARLGLILLGIAAGSEALPKVAERARADTAFSVGLMFVQLVVTLVYVPMVFLLVMPEAEIRPLKLVLKLVLLVFLPLIIGLVIRSRSERAAHRIERAAHWISTPAIALVFVLFITVHFERVTEIFNVHVALSIVVFLVVTFFLGYLLGGPERGKRVTLGLGSCMRNGSISMVVATQAFGDPEIIVMILLYFIVMVPVLAPVILLSRRRSGVS